jgi:putative hydroxymethylpyrimidine transport system substrate-binding protein
MKNILKKMILLFCFSFTSASFGAEKLIVLLDWFANPDHAPLFVAQEQGFFKEQGLDVDLIGPADPSDPPKLVAAGKADIAITYQPQYLQQIDQGLPLILIGTLIDKPLNCLTVLKTSSITSVGDLKGKTIGYSAGDMNSTMLKVMLEKNGLSLNDVNPINIHYDLTQALLSGKVDAVTGMMRNFEILQLELAGHPARVFYPEQNGMPNYSELVFVANKNQAHDPRFAKFLIAVKAGNDYLQKHPQATWNAFSAAHPELKDDLNQKAWFATLPYFAKNPAEVNKESFLRFADFMYQNGLIKKVQPMANYID